MLRCRVAVILLAGHFLVPAAMAQSNPAHVPDSSVEKSLAKPTGSPEFSQYSVTEQFLNEHSGTSILETGGLIHRVYGRCFGSGTGPAETADQFVAQYASLFGANAQDLIPTSRLPDGRHLQPLLYDAAKNNYKFTLVYFSQFHDGLPVFRADLRLLIRNAPGYPLVLAASNLRPLGDFSVDPILANLNFDPAAQTQTGMTRFTAIEKVIWAGVEDEVVEPVLAVTFIGDNDRTDATMESWRFVCHAATGQVLFKENLIQLADLTGTVQAMATPGVKAHQCTEEVPMAFPWARVGIQGGETVYADAIGNFLIPYSGSGPVTVNSYMSGLYFSVNNFVGPEESLIATVTPPESANFIHNQSNLDELVLAQVNGYISANAGRAWILEKLPTFPGVDTATGMTINVNRTDGACPCNAWANLGTGTINFCRAGASCVNMAFQSIIYHEFGHQCIDFAGSGQGAYGEGMADCIAILPYDLPDVGIGFSGDCGAASRTADNNCQYLSSGCSTCGSEVHDCGKLISGIVWSVRNELFLTNPSTYLDIISQLTVNSILLHSGTAINQQIAIDFLSLDDDDANIGNGTPHRAEICSGFTAHGLPCPALDTSMSVSPATNVSVLGPPGGPFSPDSVEFNIQNLGGNGFDYSVSSNASWLVPVLTSGSLASGASATISASVNAAALPSGTYVGTLTFTNTTTHEGDTTRLIALNVSLPRLSVTPAEGLSASGEIGGPFGPITTKVYKLQNIGGASLDFVVGQTADWETLSATVGTLAPEAATTITVSINASANALPVGTFVDTLTFSNVTNHLGDTNRDSTLDVQPLTNDNCAHAIAACPGLTYYGSTAGKGVEGSAECGSSNNTADVWYRYTPAISGLASFSLCGNGTSFDSVLSIHSGCPGSGAEELFCDDDSCPLGTGPSVISDFAVSGGTTYYFRVSGWSGATGSYALTISGPPCTAPLYLSLPNGAPAVLPAGVAVEFDVEILNGLENCMPQTAMLHYRYAGNAFLSLQMVHMGGTQYRATLPPAMCDAMPEYFVTAQGDAGGMASSPFDAPNGIYSALVGSVATAAIHDFEAGSNEGWTVGDTGDNATSGIWNRADPEGTTAQPSDDHSPGAGINCWVTDSRAGTTPASFDVDGGKTTLKSSTMDLSAFEDALIGYWRWYDNSHGTAPNADTFVIDISNNNGASWINVETIGPTGESTSGGWHYHEFWVGQFVAPTSQTIMRFVARDTGAASLIEAAVDDFMARGHNCADLPGCQTTPGDFDGNGTVDGIDIQGFVNAMLGGNRLCVDFDENGELDSADVAGMVTALLYTPPGLCATLGDLNSDGAVNGGDLQGFVDAIVTSYHPCADFDADQQLDADDVTGMTLLLLQP